MSRQPSAVAAYIEQQSSDWKPTLKKLRAACRRELTGYVEEIRHGMPSYTRDGQIEVAFAKQRPGWHVVGGHHDTQHLLLLGRDRFSVQKPGQQAGRDPCAAHKQD